MQKILCLSHAVLLASYTSPVVSVGNPLPSLTSLVYFNSNNTEVPHPWSALPAEGCCHGLPDPAAGQHDAICLVQEHGALTSHSSARGIDPFHTSREECEAERDRVDGSCRWTDPDAGTSATYCATWSETCPWEQLDAQQTCRTRCRAGGCVLAALVPEEEPGKPPVWIFFVGAVVLIGSGGVWRWYAYGKTGAAADVYGKNWAAPDVDIERNTAHAVDGISSEGGERTDAE